ncbi:DNA-processing protein DprA [Pyrobaculum sp.]|uniref:DNA-processing protein DprA n=1 Tax=Pyrobaculum sp. TaxID=2004705 RepID=UPI003D0FBF37
MGYGIRIVDAESPEYPRLLRLLPNPPRLYAVGRTLPREPAVAVASARDADEHGISLAREVGHLLAQRGVPVATGLSRGVDEAALDGALSAGGVTVGVPPSLYARGRLRREVRRLVGMGGAAVSERLEASDIRRALAERNWITVGMTKALIVAYARYRQSGWGTLIAARTAWRLGRPVVVLRPPDSAPKDAVLGFETLAKLGALVAETPEEAVERALA